MVDAASVVVALEAKVADYNAKINGASRNFEESMSRTERSANRAEASVRGTMGQIGNSTARAAAQSRNLGYQFADIGSSLASGSSPFVVLAQQLPQIANALDGTSGAVGRFASYLSGSFGAAVLAAVSVVGVLGSKLLESAGSADTKKKAIDRLKDAIDALNQSSGQAARATEAQIRLDIAAAESARVSEVAIRKKTQAQLASARAALEASTLTRSLGGGGTVPGGVSFAASQRELDEKARIKTLAALEAKQSEGIASAESSKRGGAAALALLRVAAATDTAAAATQRYENRIDALRQQVGRGQISIAQFEAQALKATRARDTATTPMRAAAGAAIAIRVSGEASGAAAKGQRDLDAALQGVIQRFDPARAAAEDYAETIRTIQSLVGSRRLSANDGMVYSLKAASEFATKAREELEKAQEAFERSLGNPSAKIADQVKAIVSDPANGVRNVVDAADRGREAGLPSAAGQDNPLITEEQYQAQQDKIRSLADFFTESFSAGSGDIFKNFERQGLRALAVLIARFAVLQTTQGNGGVGNILKNIGGAFSQGGGIAGLFGGARASGGPVSAGRHYLVGEKGPEIVAMGASGTVIPNNVISKAARQNSGGVTVLQTIAVDAKGAVMNDQFASMILARAGQDSQRAAAIAMRQGQAGLMHELYRPNLPGAR